MHPIFFQLGWNLDGDWPIRRQNPYQHQFVNVNNNNYTCCAEMAGKEETPTCRKKTVTWTKARYTRYKFCIQVSIQENLNSSLCIHDARIFYEYTQVLAGDTTNKMAFLGGEEGAALCIALLCTIVLRRRLSSKKRSTWARKWLRRRRWGVFL